MENLTEESVHNIWKEMNPRVRTTSLCWMKSPSGDTNNCHQLSRAGKIPWPNSNEELGIAVAATGRKNQKLAL